LHSFSWFSVETLVRRALDDPDARVRQSVVYAMCDMRSVSAYGVLAERLRDEADSVRDAAAWGLRECRDPEAVPVLSVVAVCAREPMVRVHALEALGANGSAEALPVVRAQVADPEPDVKYAATLSWLELAGEACLAELAAVVKRESGAARQQVLRGFFHATNYLAINVAGSTAIDALLDALDSAVQDASPDARKAAVWPLAWIAHERAACLLKRAYRDEADDMVKAHCVRVAVSLMSEAGVEIFEDALRSDRRAVRDAAELVRAAAHFRRVDEQPVAGEGPIWKR
jgi:HEAT repeat protein